MTKPQRHAKQQNAKGQTQTATAGVTVEEAQDTPAATQDDAPVSAAPVTGKLLDHAPDADVRDDATDPHDDAAHGITGSIDAHSLLDLEPGDSLHPASHTASAAPVSATASAPADAATEARATTTRKPTLTAALDRAASGPRHAQANARDTASAGNGDAQAVALTLPPPPALPTFASPSAGEDLSDDYEDEGELEDEVDEWAVADQPTVVMSPAAIRRRKPRYLDTDKQQAVWPTPASVAPRPDGFGHPDTAPDELRPSGLNGPRLAAPDGRRAPTADSNAELAALSNPRMHRFQDLRRQRLTHVDGERAPEDATPVAEMVRQWWNDLRPGLQGALRYQHDARNSGIHPISAYAEPGAASRLGDAFGRLTATARDLTERATAAAAPHLKRLHEVAEQKAQAVVEKIEGDPIRQQGPLLGPGRIAVFFRPAVTVGQAQRLLSATQARPLRIIPKRHGFLALVRPGTEASVSAQLRQHPHVTDVVYLTYDEFGDPV